MPAALIWLVFALGLAAAEALTGDMFLLMLSGGALGDGAQGVHRSPGIRQGWAGDQHPGIGRHDGQGGR